MQLATTYASFSFTELSISWSVSQNKLQKQNFKQVELFPWK